MKHSIIERKLQKRMKVCAFAFLLGACTFSIHANPTDVQAVQQNRVEVKGQVVDSNGESLIGVSIQVKGSASGAITDINGNYSISTAQGSTLVFTYIGYVPQEIQIGSQQIINVTLAEDAQVLDEVVVIGYGTLQKKQVTNAVTSISAKDLMVGVGGADISSALQGKIGGLVMYNLGSANSETTFQLRGMTSVESGKSPLIVIDGFPGGDIRALSQDDILSIDVLKDASAGAIYGTRAAAGVILITTKSGTNTNGKVKLNYTTELSHKQNYNAPEMLSGREYAEKGIGTDYGSDTNWWKELIKDNNFSQRHHFSLEMGTEKAQVYTSFFYEDNEGITFKDSRTDYGGRLNAKFKLFDDWLEISPSVDYRRAMRVNYRPDFQQAMRNNPTRSPYDENSETGYNVWLNESMDYNILADAALTDYEGLNTWFKPEVTFKLNVKPIPGLSIQQTVGFENRQWEKHEYQSRYHREELSNNRKGTARLEFEKIENLTSEGYANYIKEFKGGHTLNTVAGYSYFERNREEFKIANRDFSVDGIKYWDIGKGSYLSDGKAEMSSKKEVTERLFSVFGRVNYGYQDKYLFQGSFRREGSSKFAADRRWGTFWALSGGWRISNESFMQRVEWINDLKIRAAYGVTGNNDFDSTFMANMLGSDTNWMMPDGSWAYSYGKSQNINSRLGWEEKREWDFGLDFSILNNRVYGKFDYFIRTTDDMIYKVKVPQPPFTNGDQVQNIGSMEIKGWEIEVGADIIKTKNFYWTSSMNISHSSGKIKNLSGGNSYYNSNGFPAPGSPGDAARMEAGSKIGSFYLWKFAGFDDNGEFLLYNEEGEVIHNKEKTENDKRYLGSYNPAAIIGWNNTLVYKNWDLGINMRSWIDFDVYNSLNMYFGIQGQGNMNVLKDAYGKFDHIKGEKQLSDYYLEDGTFLKIDAVTLGYTLPMKKFTNNFVDQIRFYFTVGNLATFTKYSGMNPEVNITGWNEGTEKFWDTGRFYPVVRTYTLGLKFHF